MREPDDRVLHLVIPDGEKSSPLWNGQWNPFYHVELKNDVAKGQSVSWDDVILDDSLATAMELRRETEALVEG